MKILHVGIFQDHCLGGDIILAKGIRHWASNYEQFDYRSIACQAGRREMNRRLLEASSGKDIVLIGKGELIESATLSRIQKRGAKTAIWYGDMRPRPDDWLLANLEYCDAFFLSSAGDTLREYYTRGRPKKAAYYFNPSDPSLAEAFNDEIRSIDPPVFTGTQHSYGQSTRTEVFKYLCSRRDIQIVGSLRRFIRSHWLRRFYSYFFPPERIRGREYIQRIIRAKFGIGVSAFQDVKYYTSDRMTHYLMFGKLYLAFRFPGCDDLFEDGRELVYYESVQDLEEKIDYYLAHPELAEMIGKQGQARILNEYNATRMTRMMLDIVETGYSHIYPWLEVLP